MATTISENVGNIFNTSNVFSNQTQVYSHISDILNCVSVIVAFVGVVFGCYVINIVRQLNDDDLRSRFSLLSVLICDVILALSNLTEVIFVFSLIDRTAFRHLQCPFVYVNVVLSSIFSVCLVLSLLCLAVDQVIAVFRPLYFRTSEGTRRKIVYGTLSFIPVPFVLAILIYWTLEVTTPSYEEIDCAFLMEIASTMTQYVVVLIVPVAFSTPMIYAVVLWKIARQRCVHSENRLENIQNRRLVVSFLLLSASYFLLWMPTLAYFSVCFYIGDGCWQENTTDVTLIVHIMFILNYIVDPVTCAVRMEPIKQRILESFRYH